MFLKIGELARRTGLTVRALRHYDDIGLLVPSDRSGGGYRLYTRKDVARLYRVQALRRLDLSLAQIQRLLDSGDGDVSAVVTAQVAQLERDIQQASALREHLLAVQTLLQSNEEPEMNDWLVALESMVAGSKYFSPGELDAMKVKLDDEGDAGRPERVELLTRLQAMVAEGLSPESPEAQSLASRFVAQLLRDVGGDEGVLMKVYAMHWNEPSLHALTGVDRAGMSYISQAMEFARIHRYAPYLRPDEMATLRRHSSANNDAWPPLIAEVRRLQQAGVPAEAPQVRGLAQQWLALSLLKVGGNLALYAKLSKATRLDPSLKSGTGIDATLTDYMDQAIALIDMPAT